MRPRVESLSIINSRRRPYSLHRGQAPPTREQIEMTLFSVCLEDDVGHTILVSLNEPVTLLDRNGNVLYANRAWVAECERHQILKHGVGVARTHVCCCPLESAKARELVEGIHDV